MKQSIVRWYVAKIKPRTETKITEYLDRVGVKHFSPLQSDGQALLPGIIFVHTTYESALQLPKDSGLAMDFLYDSATHQLQFVPDKQMADFVFLQNHAGQLIILSEPEKLQGGEKVKVTGGEFLGIEGEIYRIKSHKRVIVRLGNLGAVALGSYIAKENILKI
ncbi:transcriptional regulator [Bacteroidia bacterium]|nr:transcriptional regulator [Bacteroidia bacterium]